MARIVVRRLRRWSVPVAAGVIAAAGCSAPGSAVETAPEVTAMTVGAMLA
jgi:hypothetical protein